MTALEVVAVAAVVVVALVMALVVVLVVLVVIVVVGCACVRRQRGERRRGGGGGVLPMSVCLVLDCTDSPSEGPERHQSFGFSSRTRSQDSRFVQARVWPACESGEGE
jgi:hypothetical protein